jgi:CHC2 zinc finger
MLACWRGGIVPLLQLHDCLDCSVSSRDQAELVARLGCEAVALDVPMRVDLKFGRNWGDATHSWEELQAHPARAASTITVKATAMPVSDANVDKTPTSGQRDEPQPITAAELEIINRDLMDWGIEPLTIGMAATDTSPEGKAQDPTPPPKPNSDGASRATCKILCPFHDDHSPSLQIYSDGHFHCFVCQAHGDVEELPETITAPSALTAPPAIPDTRKLERGLQLWEAANPIAGTSAERYLVEIRKLDLTVVLGLDTVLRFHPKCPFNGAVHPCVLALFRDAVTNEAAGIHRTALTADAEKIGRMMLGSWPNPRAIKLKPLGERLIIGEGIETTMAGGASAPRESALWAWDPPMPSHNCRSSPA